MYGAPNMTPKEQFLATPHAEPHRKLVQTEAFQWAINYALLHYWSSLDFSQTELAVTAAKLAGAKDLCALLKKLAEPTDQPPAKKEPGLNYDAYELRRPTG
jgi:hypothetical protein